jgi:hypothetical protein
MKIAKSRVWTPVEVEEAGVALRKEPGLWDELERLEKENGDFLESDAGRREMQIVARLHRGCELKEISDLLAALRRVRRKKLGLKTWG